MLRERRGPSRKGSSMRTGEPKEEQITQKVQATWTHRFLFESMFLQAAAVDGTFQIR